MALMPTVKLVDLYVPSFDCVFGFYFLHINFFEFYVNRYRHELFDNAFGIEWMNNNDNQSKKKTINEKCTNDQNQIEIQSISILLFEFDQSTIIHIKLNGITTIEQTFVEYKLNLLH